MPLVQRPSGVQLDLPTTLRVAAPAARRTRAGRPAGARGTADETDALVAALERQEFVIVDSIPLVTAPATPGGARRVRARAAAPVAFDLTVPLQPDENAVVLIEEDGAFRWQTQGVSGQVGAAPAAPPPRRGGARRAGRPPIAPEAVGASPGTPTVTFRIELTSVPTSAATAGAARRGATRAFPFKRFFLGRAQAIVLKFAARVVGGLAIKFFERHVTAGLVHIASANLEEWVPLVPDRLSALPRDRPARVLLLVHGTFSNTKGSYGALTATDWGRAFLRAALQRYDAILGFDHPTMSVDAFVNATDMLAALQGIGWPQPPEFDVVAFSRGGLVFRSMVEQLLPAAAWPARFRRAVFVACTNGGTQLANPDNWRRLADLYTNISVAACRAVGLFPQAAPVTVVIAEAVQGLGAFVKYLAAYATEDNGVPGLATMMPQGQFVQTLNTTQPGQPTPEDTYYCAITSDFEPAAAQLGDAPELPPKFLIRFADRPVDQLFGVENDLVVHTKSMAAIDPAIGGFIKDRHDFGTNGSVYHTNYFTRPETVAALTRWFGLVTSRTPVVRTGGVVLSVPSAALSANILVAGADTTVDALRRSLRTRAPEFVVLHRQHHGETLHYAFSPLEISEHLATAEATTNLQDALGLQEQHASSGKSAETELIPQQRPAGSPASVGRIVILHDRAPVGVLRASNEIPTTLDLVEASLPGAPRTPPPREAVRPRRDQRRGTSRGPKKARTKPRPKPSRAASGAGRAIGFGRAQAGRPPGRPAGLRLGRLKGGGTARKGLYRGSGGAAPRLGQPRRMAQRPPIAVLPLPAPAPPNGGGVARQTRSRPRAAPAAPARRRAATRVTTPQVECHFRAEMNDEIVLGQTTGVEVLVSREQIERAARRSSASAAAKVALDRKLIVSLTPRAHVELVGEDRVEIDVPPPGDPRTIMFDVRGAHVGQGEVWVQVRQGPVPLVTLKLSTAIVETRTGAVRRAVAAADIEQFPEPRKPLNTLRISEIERGAVPMYEFVLEFPGLKILRRVESKPITGDRAGYIAGLYQELERAYLDKKSSLDAFQADVRAIGGRLYDELVPDEMQRLLWDNRNKIKLVQVFSTEPFVPWELLLVKEPGKRRVSPEARFLGEMGVVRWIYDGYPPEEVRIRRGKALYVIPQYPLEQDWLPEAQKEAAYLQETFAATAVTPNAAEVYKVLSAPGGFDLLHFACHGEAESAQIGRARLLMQGELDAGGEYVEDYVLATTVEQEGELRGPKGEQPVVVLNACRIGREGKTLTGTGGFAQAFVRAGAGVFVGTLWAVGDYPARSFTEAFYAELKKGKRLAEATAAARKSAKEAGDATWLAYVVYGDPQASLRGT